MKQNVTVAITVYGKVQGVGFRPLVCRLAEENALTGFVRNAGTHVEIVVTGEPEHIEKLCDSLRNAAPPVRVDKICREEITGQCKTNSYAEVSAQAGSAFISVASTDKEEIKCVAADIGICSHCLQELKEKGNRREGY